MPIHFFQIFEAICQLIWQQKGKNLQIEKHKSWLSYWSKIWSRSFSRMKTVVMLFKAKRNSLIKNSYKQLCWRPRYCITLAISNWRIRTFLTCLWYFQSSTLQLPLMFLEGRTVSTPVVLVEALQFFKAWLTTIMIL
jgi:hypothetical protein